MENGTVKEFVKLVGINEPINSVTIISESGEEKDFDIHMNYEIEKYHATAGELVLYIKSGSKIKYEKVLRVKENKSQINMEFNNE